MENKTKEQLVIELADFAYDCPEVIAASLAIATYKVRSGEEEDTTIEEAEIALKLATEGMKESEESNFVDFILDGLMAVIEESDLASGDLEECDEDCVCWDCPDCEDEYKEDEEDEIEIFETSDLELVYEDLLREFMANQGHVIMEAQENRKRNLETLKAMGFDVSGLE
jgi:hypothetical protein